MGKKTNQIDETALRTGYFAELADLREAAVDADGATIRNVTLIRPGFSTNADKAGRHRYYPAETLKAAVRHFEGTRAYINHPSRSGAQDLPERSVLDIAGYWENVKASEDGRLTGDLRIVGRAGADVLPLIVEAITKKPGLVDVSINALGSTKIGEAEGRKAMIVEAIVGANSVDIVTTGAAGGSFANSLLASDGDGFTQQLLGAITFEEWREARPEFLDKLKVEWKTTRDDGALKEARAEIQTLKTQAATLAEQHRAESAELADLRRGALADRLLSESKLPHNVRAKERADVLAAGDEAGMKAVIERAKVKYADAPKPPVPVNGAGQRSAAAHDAIESVSANPVLEAFGVKPGAAPKEGESPAEWHARIRKTK